MEIAANSLYSDGIVNVFSDGSKQLMRLRSKHVPQSQDFWHVLLDGETIYELANRYYGNEKIWWLIADANRLSNAINIAYLVGQYLLIPNFDNYILNRANEDNQSSEVIGELAEIIESSDFVLDSYFLRSFAPFVPTVYGLIDSDSGQLIDSDDVILGTI